LYVTENRDTTDKRAFELYDNNLKRRG